VLSTGSWFEGFCATASIHEARRSTLESAVVFGFGDKPEPNPRTPAVIDLRCHARPAESIT
jgi:hypothetical protein